MEPRVLLKQLQTCVYRLEPYWSYEYCHGKHLRQYHEEKVCCCPYPRNALMVFAEGSQPLIARERGGYVPLTHWWRVGRTEFLLQYTKDGKKLTKLTEYFLGMAKNKVWPAAPCSERRLPKPDVMSGVCDGRAVGGWGRG